MFPDELTKSTQSIGPQFRTAISSMIQAGVTNGFDGARDVARQFLGTLSSQLLNMAVTSILRNVAGGSFFGGYVEGGDFIADRPGFFPAGEAGAERVTVEPLTGSNAGKFSRDGGGGGDTVTLNLNVNGSLGGMSRAEVKNLVKAAYMEAVTKGNSVRRVNASQTRRSL